MPPLSEATRPLMWNVSQAWVMYVLFAAAVAVFAWGMCRRVRSWRRGKEDGERFSDWGKRLKILLGETLLQNRVRRNFYPGLLHGLLFYSFLVLFITTLIVMVQYDGNLLFGLDLEIFKGGVYVFFSVASELAGLLILAGLGMAAWRRYVARPGTLPVAREDGLVLLLVAALVVTGYLVEGARIGANGDPWKELSFVGWGLSPIFAGMAGETARGAHAALWWLHTVLVMGWIALIPYTKFFHMLALPTNAFLSKLGPRGELRRQDIEKLMESAESEEIRIGIQKPEEFSWKQRLDLDACILCGRCDEVCPAYMADRDYFSPRQLIARMKAQLDEAAGAEEGEKADIVGRAFDEEFIWHCRTCAACVEVCPAMIEHVDTLMELRRNEVLIQGRIPEEAGRALRLFETGGNPFGPQSERTDWIERAGLRVVKPGESVDVLYWIGCCVTFDPQKHRIAEDLCRLLERCGVDYGVLGADERCCGDPARILGQEMVFQQAAREQIELLGQRGFHTLLTGCPHCYNVFKNEYPQFGASYNVVHHTEYIERLMASGRIRPGSGRGRMVYHDPCYLGRYQGIYDAPRSVLRAIPGAELAEMKNRREKSLCCGAGGGHYFMDLKRGERINNLRVRQAHEAGADTIVTGCAYCMHMLGDSLKLLNVDESMRVIDIASLTAESLDDARK